jgi:hypothetical protein
MEKKAVLRDEVTAVGKSRTWARRRNTTSSRSEEVTGGSPTSKKSPPSGRSQPT